MKNKKFVSKKDIEEVVFGLWKTDLFKNSQKENGTIINILVNKLKQIPFVLYEKSSDIEKAHMTLWFYHVDQRVYENPYINDLYYFHEFYHLVTFPESRLNTFIEFKDAMWENELKASLMSEVYIYYFMPELRKKTFEYRIWFDDIIEKYNFQKIIVNEDIFDFKNMPEIFIKIKNRRLELRSGVQVDLETEKWIQKFNNKDNWFEKWREDIYFLENLRNNYKENLKNEDLTAYEILEKDLLIVTENDIPFYNVLVK